ncbi:hypothetical protein PoB_005659700 [Plakobranchus ocellatus]|uniref:Uncharacterized protein n=1 Tax=Plakobranchus ocellatus TaxID=259542 RepID=A0AAV4CFQ3_9GAST|nr:hypothetical protein PoB_005659700 [Plakobranchus ocellatus]
MPNLIYRTKIFIKSLSCNAHHAFGRHCPINSKNCTPVDSWALPKPSNEIVERLAKSGSFMKQIDTKMSPEEARTLIKATVIARWIENHQSYNKKDPNYQLNRQHQITIFRLHTDHNRLRKQMFTKPTEGETLDCHCGSGLQTAEHLLQPAKFLALRISTSWTKGPPPLFTQKLNDTLEDMTLTTVSVLVTGLKFGHKLCQYCEIAKKNTIIIVIM